MLLIQPQPAVFLLLCNANLDRFYLSYWYDLSYDRTVPIVSFGDSSAISTYIPDSYIETVWVLCMFMYQCVYYHTNLITYVKECKYSLDKYYFTIYNANIIFGENNGQCKLDDNRGSGGLPESDP